MEEKKIEPANKKSDHVKNILHGFFLSIGTTIAEPHTILPLIISHFGGGPILIGLFSSLLRGGAILVQLYAAFHAQSYPRMMKYFRRVLTTRFISWLSIGIAILLFGEDHPTFTLWCIGIGLFIFSFSAGFGAIYFREIIAKIFSHKFRGKTMSARQFFSGFGALISGAAAGYILEIYPAPYSFGYLFVASAFIMGFGYLAIGTVAEPIKEKVATKEKSFKLFLKNAFATLKSDKQLKIQVSTFLFAYSYLFALPFIIVDAGSKINLDGTAIGLLITAQMIGAMFSNIVWAKLSGNGLNKLTAHITISMTILAIALAFIASSLYMYMFIFFIIGASMDGNRIASGNLILILAPEEKRPVYTALQTNIVSFGMFFSIAGGIILNFSNYTFLYSFTLILLSVALLLSFKLKDNKEEKALFK
ncbi:MAG: MFS transporter [Campylobacteraceae bacterium]|jgi:MFS family permease|nr:MFS transporter [Campylobacteraceae bacterium]MBT3883051.1 MFS transporter [Campylobacteraceae bacterium]MBT4030711.1 MFS transporter [Campylobacteraceae bacterium]MBT4178600.1 MFS transporter [Campylobacteraceae bacterium]MBT4572682.1 MFS transporter [Campylobacteraceae bacterium]